MMLLSLGRKSTETEKLVEKNRKLKKFLRQCYFKLTMAVIDVESERTV